MGDFAIRVEDLSKKYHIGAKQQYRGSFRETIVDTVNAPFRRAGKLLRGHATGAAGLDEVIWALKDVSFDVKHGEVVGIIGRNGAGKSTLLKILSRITKPTEGRARLYGRVGSLLEVGTGFHPELTGRENIYLNASILGMRRAEIDAKLDAIIDFSGVAEFIDTPVKRYSSGMQARLGFAVAAHVEPDVLLVDEVLSVGDALFRQRCVQRMRELVDGGTILLFVTHNLEQMQSFCSRAIVLNRGGIAFDGDTTSAVTRYIAALEMADVPPADLSCGETASITDVRVRTPSRPETVVVDAREPLEFEVSFQLSRPVRRLSAEVDVRREVGALLANFNSIRDEETFGASPGEGICTLSVPTLPLAGGRYLVRAVLRDADTSQVIADTGHRYSIAIEDHARPTGILMLPHTWSYRAMVGELPSRVSIRGVELEQV